MEFPSLVIYNSRIRENQTDQTQRDGQFDWLMNKASMLYDAVKKWMTAEAEPQFLSNTSSRRVAQGQIEYPDILSGVLDCIANTALLTIGKMLRLLCHIRLRSSSRPGRSRQYSLKISRLLENQETIEQQRQRAMRAFDFVKGESNLAARPLEFGLRQVHSSGSIDALDSGEIRSCWTRSNSPVY